MNYKVVIVGAGEVGYNLALRFAREDFDITVIEKDPQKCNILKNTVDATVIEGDGASQRTLQQISMSDIDIFLALTKIDEVNLVSAQIGKNLGASKVICRLRNTEYIHKKAIATYKQFGIDFATFPERAVQREIEMLIRQSASVEIQEYKNGLVTLVGIHIEPSSPLIGRSVQNVELSNPFIRHKLVAVTRNGSNFIPHKDTKYHKGDIIYFVGKTTDIKRIQKMAGKPVMEINNIMILGAGKVGRLLAKSLQNEYDVRIIEKNHEKAEIVGLKLSNTLILNDSGTNIDFLESERISKVDCFIAVTDNEQLNILSSLLAKDMGAKQVITHITTSAYIPAVRRIGVDAVVSKNIAAVNEVINFIRSDEKISVSRFEDIDIDAIELSVSSTCKYIKKKYSLEKIPEEISLGAIFRNKTSEITNPHTIIKPDDELLMFTKQQHIQKAEDLFK